MTTNHPFTVELKRPIKPATEAALSKFERTTQLTIPREYREFLRCQNGGVPVKRNFRFGRKPYQDSILRHFLGVGVKGAFDVSYFIDVYHGRIPERTFPIASDEFDNLILVSQQRGSTNHVLFWDHEKESSRKTVTLIAENLKSFLATLKSDEIVEYQIATITFYDGEVERRIVPSKLMSLDRNKVIDIQEAKAGERIVEFGVKKRIRDIRYTMEKGIG